MKRDEMMTYKDIVRDVVRSDGETLAFYDQNKNIWRIQVAGKAAMSLQRILDEKGREKLSYFDLKQLAANILCDPDFYNPLETAPVNLINCESGVLDLDEMKMVTADKEQCFQLRLDFNIIKEVKTEACQTFISFMRFAFALPASLRDDDIPKQPSVVRLLEMLGYMVSNEFRAKKLLILLGPANSGKSQILELLRMVIGHDNTVALTLDEVTGRSGGRFRTELLHKAHALVNDELPTAGLKHLAELKKVIAGEAITIEAKGARPMTIRNRTKLMFAGNQLPELDEADCGGAFASRLCVVALKNSPTAEEKDIDLLSKLYDERSAIFSMAVQAFAAMRKRNLTFTEESDAEALIRAYMDENASVLTFIHDDSIIGVGDGIHVDELYQRYCSYCEDLALPTSKQKSFRQQLLSIPKIKGIKKVRLKNDKNPRSTVLGIEFVAK